MEEIINKAYNIYNSQNDNKSKLNDFIVLYDEHCQKLLENIKKLDNDNIRNKYQLVYEKQYDDINTNIFCLYEILTNSKKSIDDDELLILQLSLLRLIMVGIMVMQENYYIELNGVKEMKILPTDKYDINEVKYYVYLSNNEPLIKLYGIFIIFFYLQTIMSNGLKISLDFEFTNNRIELTQQAFENPQTPIIFLWIIKPTELTEYINKNYIDLIMTNNYLWKILHGSDSKDIPYLFTELFNNDRSTIIKFTKKLIDTRFLCEYFKIVKNEVANKCSIYDALLYFDVLSDEQYKNLLKIVDDMGPVQDIVWNIHRLSKAQTLYALYDVLYLKQFYLKMIKMAMDGVADRHRDSQKILYKKLLTELIQFVYLERREITAVVPRCKLEVDPINNYMVKKSLSGKNVNHTLITVYNNINKGIIIPDPIFDLDKLLNVNYFKGQMITILKKIVYTIITHKYKIFKDKNTMYTDKLSLGYLFEHMDEYEFPNIKKLLTQFILIAESKIDQYIDK
jgi:hypothetical protein